MSEPSSKPPIPPAAPAKHTPGPWRADIEARYINIRAHMVTVPVAQIPVDDDLWPVEVDRANAQRIVACVNACAGLADPGAVPEMLRMLNEHASILMACEDDSPGAAMYIALERLLARAEHPSDRCQICGNAVSQDDSEQHFDADGRPRAWAHTACVEGRQP